MENKIKYISNGTWFDNNTEAKLLVTIDDETGIFNGIRKGKSDEELCLFDEFDIRRDCEYKNPWS